MQLVLGDAFIVEVPFKATDPSYADNLITNCFSPAMISIQPFGLTGRLENALIVDVIAE